MREIIQKQLTNVKFADLSNCKDGVYLIKKRTDIKLEVDNNYIIKIDPHLTDPSFNPTLTSNFNAGNFPHNICYKAEVCQIMANLVKIHGIAIDESTKQPLNEIFMGFLPINQIKIVEKLV